MSAHRRPHRQVSFRLRPEAAEYLKRVAAERQISQGEVVERLLIGFADDPPAYLLKQAAFQSFIAAGLSTYLASQLLSMESATRVRRRAGELAEQLFGPAPRRPPGYSPPEGLEDPRVEALFEVFGVDLDSEG